MKGNGRRRARSQSSSEQARHASQQTVIAVRVGQRVGIVREYPKASGEPYYPIPRPENEALYKRYQELANAEAAVKFVGRLAQYRYYNMDQIIGAALVEFEKLAGFSFQIGKFFLEGDHL